MVSAGMAVLTVVCVCVNGISQLVVVVYVIVCVVINGHQKVSVKPCAVHVVYGVLVKKLVVYVMVAIELVVPATCVVYIWVVGDDSVVTGGFSLKTFATLSGSV
jgi:hypothetical protein